MFANNFIRLIYIGLSFIQNIGNFGYQFAFVPIKDNDFHKITSLGGVFNPISLATHNLIDRFFGNFTYFELLLTIGLTTYCFVIAIKIVINLINPIKM